MYYIYDLFLFPHTEYVAHNHVYSKTGASWIFQGNKRYEKGM